MPHFPVLSAANLIGLEAFIATGLYSFDVSIPSDLTISSKNVTYRVCRMELLHFLMRITSVLLQSASFTNNKTFFFS